jgi:hypothetical protein
MPPDRGDDEARMLNGVAGTTIALFLAAVSPALSQSIEHAYTRIDLKACKHTPGRIAEDYGSWLCKGYAGIPIYISGGDQRSFVSYGRNAKREIANRESLMSFNGHGDVVEWRIETLPGGKKRPFAAIMRWSTTVQKEEPNPDGEIVRGQVLVITRLDPGGVCHVGYVDGRANPNANELARKIADEKARAFRCGKDAPDSHGKTGPGYSPRMLMH